MLKLLGTNVTARVSDGLAESLNEDADDPQHLESRTHQQYLESR